MALGSAQPLTEMSTREYFLGGKGGRCLGLTTLPPSSANLIEIWERLTPWILRACSGLYKDCFSCRSVHYWTAVLYVERSLSDGKSRIEEVTLFKLHWTWYCAVRSFTCFPLPDYPTNCIKTSWYSVTTMSKASNGAYQKDNCATRCSFLALFIQSFRCQQLFFTLILGI